jgi:hypothetical protein
MAELADNEHGDEGKNPGWPDDGRNRPGDDPPPDPGRREPNTVGSRLGERAGMMDNRNI